MISDVIGANIRRLRRARGWTQDDLANRVGRARANISRTETGAFALNAPGMLAFAEALEVDVSELFLGLQPWVKEPS